MKSFVKVMSSVFGRGLRIVVGSALIAWGLVGMEGEAGVIVSVVGALPLMTGIFDICLFGPLLGTSVSGKKVRAGG